MADQSTHQDDDMETLKQELADFAYIVSHDLKAPIRHMREFSRILVQRLEHAVGNEEQKFVTFIEEAADKAEAMLAALQEVSRLNTHQEPFADVDLSELVSEVIAQMQTKSEKVDAHISVSNLPIVEGKAKQLHQLFMHLLDNALTYRNVNTSPVIEISATTQGDTHRIIVNDNGPGINDAYKEQIFGLFKKGEQNVDGKLGTGLYICQKIVHHHHGTIHCEDSENGGTAFIVELAA